MASDRSKIEALLAAKTSASARLFSKLIAAIRRRVPSAGSDGWYRDYLTIVDQLAALAEAAQRVQAAQAAQFTAQTMRVLGDEVQPAQVDVSDVRRGVDPAVVWQRPFEEYRFQVSQGKPVAEAVELAVQRAEVIADLNLQRAADVASRATMAKSKKVIGYRRVIHPELSAGGTCGLCIAASTRLYKVSTLKALHARCHCDVIAVYKGQDVGNGMNVDDIRRVYSVQVFDTADLAKLAADNAGSLDGRQLKYTRYQVNEHGELGPVITRKGDHFKDSGAPDRVITPVQARHERDLVVQELARALADDADAATVAALRKRISRLNSIAARAAA